MKEPGGRILLGVAMIGMAILVFETILTRIFAVTLWYYFGFLAISVALLGISAGGMAVYVLPKLGQRSLSTTLGVSAQLFGITALLAVYFHTHVTFIDSQIGEMSFYLRLMAQVFVLSAPFFFGGLCLALIFTRFHQQISRIYFCDLLGSGIGCALVIFALTVYSGPAIVFLVGTLSAVAGLCFSGERRKWVHAVLVLLFAGGFVMNDQLGLLQITTTKSYQFGQLQQKEKPELVEEQWSPISRTTIFGPFYERREDLVHLLVDNDAGAPTRIHKYRGSLGAMAYTAKRAGKLPHFLVDGHHLLIGAGGGYEIWASLVTGHTVMAVELNPITVNWVHREFADFSGDPYGQEGVRFAVSEGRNFVAHTDERFDIIELTMVDSWIGNAAGAFMFVENNLYTLEAIQAYRSKLTDEGVLTISRYYPYNEGLRIASTVSEALLQEGIEDPGQHMVIVRNNAKSVTTVMAFKQPVTAELAEKAAKKIGQLEGVLVWAPHVDPSRFAKEGEDDASYAELMAASRDVAARARFIDAFPRDISPTTDDHPFFFYMRKGSVFETNPREHAARSLAMPIVYGLFIALGILSALFLIAPALWVMRKPQGEDRRRLPPVPMLLYFACLGIGFMLVEIPLIQKFVLFLGHPTYAFTIILASILVFSGIGSYVSGRVQIESSPKTLLRFLAALVALSVIMLVTVDPLLHALLGTPLVARVVVTIVFLAPLAALMGMPFPSGIRLLGTITPEAVPWAWAINGAFSVLATVLALVIALNYGITAALLIGCAVYAGALALVAVQVRRPAA